MCWLNGAWLRFNPLPTSSGPAAHIHDVRQILTGPRYRHRISTHHRRRDDGRAATTTTSTNAATIYITNNQCFERTKRNASVRACVLRGARQCVCTFFYVMLQVYSALFKTTLRTRMHRLRYHSGSSLITHRLRLLLVSSS